MQKHTALMIFFVKKKEKKTHESGVFLRKKLKKVNQNAPPFFCLVGVCGGVELGVTGLV